MPRKTDAVAIARIDCLKCSQRATVYQANNGYLYTRCPNEACKANLSRDQDFQVAVWQRMEPIKGATDGNGVPVIIRRPRNVPKSIGDIGAVLKGEPPVVVIEAKDDATATDVPSVVPRNVPTDVPTNTVQASVHVPETPSEKPAKKPAASVQNRVPAPIGSGSVQTEKESGGAGFWLLLLTLAGGAGWLVHQATSNDNNKQAAQA